MRLVGVVSNAQIWRCGLRAWQKEANIAQLPNTYNGIYKELRSEVKIQTTTSAWREDIFRIGIYRSGEDQMKLVNST